MAPTLGRSRLVLFSVENLTLNGPLFLQSLFICSTNFLNAGDRGFDSRTFLFFVWFFFGTMRLFFENFRILLKGFLLCKFYANSTPCIF